MTPLFADAGYFIALLVARDQFHQRARVVSGLVATTPLVTTQPVIFEVFDHMSGLGPIGRSAAVDLLLRLQARTTIVPLTPELFEAAVELYGARLDKGYSLTDASSMVACRNLGITEVLSNDHHFEQEGFKILL